MFAERGSNRLWRSSALHALWIAALGLAGCGGGGGPGENTTAVSAPAAVPATTTGDWRWNLPAHMAPPPVPADNPMSMAKFELGRSLFHDTRLSGSGIQSCSSCHLQARAFTDGLPLSRGATGELTLRNSQPLANVAWLPTLTWNGTQQKTLEQQMLIPLFGTHPIEMGLTDSNRDTVLARLRGDAVLVQQFKDAFPLLAQPVEMDTIIAVIATYQRGLVSANSAVDRQLQGQAAMGAAALRGQALFFSPQAQCAACHTADQIGLPFLAPGFHNTGLYNVDGRGAYPAGNTGLIEESGRAEDMGKFRAPSLRNVELTAPYMHDGSVATLPEVLALYAAGGRVLTTGPFAGDGRRSPLKSPLVDRIQLNAAEQADLLAFLLALTDRAFVSNPALGAPAR